jgi:PRC-barrel domain
MVREGAPTTSLFAPAKDMDADRSLCPGIDPCIGMTESAAESVQTAVGGCSFRPRQQTGRRTSPMLKITFTLLMAASIAYPAMAQTPAPPANRSATSMGIPAPRDTSGNPSGSGNTTPSTNNTAMTDNGGMRASEIIGSPVYNDHDEKIGSIDDLVIGSDQTLSAVVSVGGFLGMGSKMVQVPFNKLEFGNTKGSSNGRAVIPGANKDSLNEMPDYHYVNRG